MFLFLLYSFWFTLFNLLSYSYTQVTNCMSISFFTAAYYSVMDIYHIFMIHLPVNGHLSCFHILAIELSVAMNDIYMHHLIYAKLLSLCDTGIVLLGQESTKVIRCLPYSLGLHLFVSYSNIVLLYPLKLTFGVGLKNFEQGCYPNFRNP